MRKLNKVLVSAAEVLPGLRNGTTLGAQTGAGPARSAMVLIRMLQIFTPAIPGSAELCKRQKYLRGQPGSFLTETEPRPVAYTREVASLAYPG